MGRGFGARVDEWLGYGALAVVGGACEAGVGALFTKKTRRHGERPESSKPQDIRYSVVKTVRWGNVLDGFNT